MLRLDSKDILFLAFYWQTLERVSDRHSAAELLAVVGFNNQLKNFVYSRFGCFCRAGHGCYS